MTSVLTLDAEPELVLLIPLGVAAPLHPAAEWLDGKACPYKPCSDYCRFPLPYCMVNSEEDEVSRRVEAFVTRTLVETVR